MPEPFGIILWSVNQAFELRADDLILEIAARLINR